MTDNYMDTRRKKLASLLKTTNIKQKDVADFVGVIPDMIRQYINGEKKSPKNIERSIKYIEDIINESDDLKLLIVKLRKLKDSELSRITELANRIIEGKESEFRGLVPACAPGEPAGEKSKLKKEGK